MNDLTVALLSAGYDVWCPLDPENPTWIVGDGDKLCKCAIRKAFISNEIPTVNISSPLSKIDCTHLLIWEPLAPSAWLIPVEELPQVDHIRLSVKYESNRLCGVEQLTRKQKKELRAAMLSQGALAVAAASQSGDVSFLERNKDVKQEGSYKVVEPSSGVPGVAGGNKSVEVDQSGGGTTHDHSLFQP